MRKIKLTQGKYALVDDDKYEYLNQWKWCFHKQKTRKTGYAVRATLSNGKKSIISMHRVILIHYYNKKSDQENMVDHINKNGIDNRIKNLRIVNRYQSEHNKTVRRNNVCGSTGIYKRIENGKFYGYMVELTYKKNKYRLGCFDTLRKAKMAYNKKLKEVFGECFYAGE